MRVITSFDVSKSFGPNSICDVINGFEIENLSN